MSRLLLKEKTYHFLYKTTNIITGMFYIGMHSTNNLDDGYLGSGKRLSYSIRKYGKDNHNREILEFFNSRDELVCKEKEMINTQMLSESKCMNLKLGGQYSSGMLGKTHTEEWKRNHSLCMKGRSFSDEHKDKIRESLKGKTLPNEHKEKISNSLKGNKNSLGVKHNPEKGRKHSELLKGKKLGPQIQVTCPHCNKVGSISAMKHWHFEKCKIYNKTLSNGRDNE